MYQNNLCYLVFILSDVIETTFLDDLARIRQCYLDSKNMLKNQCNLLKIKIICDLYLLGYQKCTLQKLHLYQMFSRKGDEITLEN